MCGIVGMVNGHPVARDLVAALGRLEYRGYDSAGVAVAGPGFLVHKVTGPAAGLRPVLDATAPAGRAGIGHTRWATHGRAEARNAHPHEWGGVAVVHNGIIENHDALRAALSARGHVFASDTDSEVIPHLMAEAIAEGQDALDALVAACEALEGAYAIAAVTEAAPGRLLVARRGSPLVVARGGEGFAIASDPIALAGLAREYTPLAEGEVAELTGHGITFHGARLGDRRRGTRRRLAREWRPIAGAAVQAGDDRPHTRREISEQEAALTATDAALRGRTLPAAVMAAERLTLIACGSSLLAGGVARDAIERAAGVTLDLEVASEFRDRAAPPQGAALLVSQSGETADTLAAMQRFLEAGLPTVAVVNAPDSAMARAASTVWPVSAGPEIGVAATKSFTSQLLALLRLGLALGEARGTGDAGFRAELTAALDEVPALCAAAEALEERARAVAARIVRENEALFIGRGWGAALAQEGALKLKELSYIRAEGYAAGELKHGPIALVREGSPVLVCAPSDGSLPKVLANASAVAARGADVVLLTDAGGAHLEGAEVVALPGGPLAAPFTQAVFLQLVSYHAATLLGRDVDRPRNLAKSVTVE